MSEQIGNQQAETVALVEKHTHRAPLKHTIEMFHSNALCDFVPLCSSQSEVLLDHPSMTMHAAPAQLFSAPSGCEYTSPVLSKAYNTD